MFEGMKEYSGVDGKIRILRKEKKMESMNKYDVREGINKFVGSEMIK